jgi:tetratricopeptide (TPR) repeat protein
MNEWLLERLRLSPKGALLAIPTFRWKSIYTVNFDTLLEDAFAATAAPIQRVHPLYSDKDPIAKLKPHEVPLYKLHGCISRANSDEGRLILTHEDTALVRQGRTRLFNRLFDDMADFSILFVGFRRQDPDFTSILVDVGQAAGALTGLPRSYALHPGFNDFEARRWEQRRVTLIDMSAEDFFRELTEMLAPDQRALEPEQKTDAMPSILTRKPRLTPEIISNIQQNFEIVDERVRGQEPNTAEFFIGGPPNWAAIAAGVDAKRDVIDDILGTLLTDPLLDRGTSQVVLVHAEAGTGKSTLLRRIAFELALSWDRIVLALKPYGSLDFLDLERVARAAAERVFVIVDDAVPVGREISVLAKNSRETKTKLTVIAAARTNEWREVYEEISIPGIEEFELDKLSLAEIKAVIDTLSRNDKLGLLAGTSEQTKIAAFQERAEKQLLVALREATEGKRFDEIVVDEYDRIPSPDAQRAYLLVAALHRLGILTRAGLLKRSIGIPFTELGHRVFEPAAKIIVPREVLDDTEQYYSTRHELIAQIVYDRKVQSERRSLEFYLDLLRNLDLGYSSDADAFKKISRGKNRQLLRDFKDPASQRELMGQMLELDPSDALVHQHAAMMELDNKNLMEASKHLNRAVELLPTDPSIRDTEGRLALASAIEETDALKANEKFARAEDIFLRNRQRRSDEPFAYRHLAETYTSWSDRQSDRGKRVQYLSLAYQTLLEGLEKSNSISMLLQYQGELEQKLGNPEEARIAFHRALKDKPGALITRFMAARLEEQVGHPENGLKLLEDGLADSANSPELHYRIAVLMAVLQPGRENEIRAHFEAALLGPIRNYLPRLAFGAYLFSKRDFAKAGGPRCSEQREIRDSQIYFWPVGEPSARPH